MPKIYFSPNFARSRCLCAAPLLASLLLTACSDLPAPVDSRDDFRQQSSASTTTGTQVRHPPRVDAAALRKDLETTLRGVPDNRIEILPQGLRVSLPANDGFVSNRTDIKPPLAALLQRIAPVFNRHPGADIYIVGHTDAVGSEMHNLRLSIQRAETVMEYLRMQGVGLERMSADGHGEAEPIADNRTADGRARNRRVEFFLKQH
jgi:outer membrane protein OmpA-like peptidoglycan-associated protein